MRSRPGVALPKTWSDSILRDVCLGVGKVDPIEFGRDSFKYVDIGAIDNKTNYVRQLSPIPVKGAPSRARQLIQCGDTVFSTVRPYLRNIAWIDESLDGEIASTGFCVLRPNPAKVEARFLFYYSMSDFLLGQVLPLQRGVSYPAVRDGDLFNSEIGVPPLGEQAKIVEILEEQLARLDAVVKSVQTVREKAAQFRRSLFHAAFTGQLPPGDSSIRFDPQTWQQVELESLIVDCQPGFASGKHNSEGRGVIHMRPMNISRRGVLDLSELRYVEVYGGHRLHRGDVVFNNTNSPALVGKTALIDIDTELAYSNHMTRLRVDGSKVMPEYLALRLHSLWEDGFFEEICSNHVNQASVSSKRLMKVTVEVPEVSVQDALVGLVRAMLAHLDAVMTVCDGAEVKADALRRSLLHAAFSGELTRSWREANV
jgi:type I restriction enzyme S subunit